MFDAALASDNPAVKKALRNFMMVTALVHAQEDGDERIMGPLETLVKKVGDLERMVYELQNTRVTRDQYRDYYKDYIGTNPTWVYQQPTTSGTTSWSTDYSSDLKDLLKDLKIT